jgi:hypothetical protein
VSVGPVVVSLYTGPASLGHVQLSFKEACTSMHPMTRQPSRFSLYIGRDENSMESVNASMKKYQTSADG